MRTRIAVALTPLMILASPLLAQTPSTTAAPAKPPIPISVADLKWVDLDPKGAPGVKVVDVWGDHTKGAYGAFFKLPAGFAAPLHTHTYDIKVVFISGMYVQQPEGKPAFRLGPGSYLMQPGGNYRHTTSCEQGADCVFYAESDGPFDLLPVAATAPR